MNRFALSLFIFTMISCKSNAPLPTVSEVDINQYKGKWYEIARLPNSFEKNLKCTTAEYALKENGKISVKNSGVNEKNGKTNVATAVAWVPNKEHPGQLKVRFFWPFAGDYYIIELDENYQYALVGAPDRKYLWVLSRTKTMQNSTYDALMKKAKSLGFDIDKVMKVAQDCNNG